MSFKGVSQLKLVNGTVTKKAYQDNIISDTEHQFECPMSQAFKKIAHLAKLCKIFTRSPGTRVVIHLV